MRAVRSGGTHKLRSLIDEGINLNFVDSKSGMTPLMLAANSGHTEVVRLLMSAGSDVHLAASDGASALHWAASRGHEEIAALLIDGGADVNRRRDSGQSEGGPTPLHFAISQGSDAIALMLIDAGASLDIEYVWGDVEAYARHHGREAVVKRVRERQYR
ncbi:MAG: ankyrin repeat domain-containing protein [Planctomycetota bacterium]